jgi:putative ABC transport system permease protein
VIERWNRLLDFLRRGILARELDEELRFHQRQLERSQRAAGLNETDAAHAARRLLGNRTFISEEARAMWSFAWLEDLVHDLRYGLRSLRRSPAFAGVAVLTLALGIGANTAIFTVVNGVLFKALPYGDAGRLVMLWETTKDAPQIFVAYPNYLDWRGRMQSFDDVALYNGFGSFNLTGMGDAERVKGGKATGNLFDVLRVHPALGRGFRTTDDAVGAERVAIIGDAFWKRRFAADSGVIGKRMTLDGFSYTIVGVLPPRVRLTEAEVWVPIGLSANAEQFRQRETHPGTIGLARLKAGVTLERMHADLDALYRQLRSDYPRENAGINASGGWLLDQVLRGIRPALYVLAGAVGLVLLIACANVANLLLGRASSRQREIALRVAIGARGGRIVRQLLTESVLLSLMGGALGTALAWGGVRVLLALRPSNIPRLAEIGLDASVLAFALGISVLTGIAFGLMPALQSTTGDLLASLKDGGRGASAGRNRLKLRSTLMVAEVALALVLLVGAGLLLRSFEKLVNVDPGVDPHNVTVGLVSLPEAKYPDPSRQRALFTELLARAKAIPRVTDAALASDLPVTSNWQSGVTFEGLPPVAPGSEPLLNVGVVSPEWFSTMRMRIVAGRGIEATDVSDGPAVMVISASVARRFYSDGNPVGRRIKMGRAASSAPWITIVGVVSDVQDSGPSIEPRGTIYFPIAQNTPDALWLAVRTAGPAAQVVPRMREALAAIDKEVPLASVGTLEERLDGSVAQPKFSMLMLGIFAAIALVLAAVGIYGVISYSVAQRTHEIGLRIALGARRLDVLMMVVRQVLVITAIGIVIGGAGALATGSLLTGLLFGVRAGDPVTFASVSIGLALVALVAAAVPALRAARLDPVAALRGE